MFFICAAVRVFRTLMCHWFALFVCPKRIAMMIWCALIPIKAFLSQLLDLILVLFLFVEAYFTSKKIWHVYPHLCYFSCTPNLYGISATIPLFSSTMYFINILYRVVLMGLGCNDWVADAVTTRKFLGFASLAAASCYQTMIIFVTTHI
ncbi:hypothetical protein ACJX0J_026271 [Zea mays]